MDLHCSQLTGCGQPKSGRRTIDPGQVASSGGGGFAFDEFSPMARIFTSLHQTDIGGGYERPRSRLIRDAYRLQQEDKHYQQQQQERSQHSLELMYEARCRLNGEQEALSGAALNISAPFANASLTNSTSQSLSANQGNQMLRTFVSASNSSDTLAGGEFNSSALEEALRVVSEGHLPDLSNYGLEMLSEHWQTCLIILYSLTAITSFVLNVITIIVLSRYRGSELRKYLINLSISDLLMSLFSIPFTYTEYMLGRWIFPKFLCPLIRFVVTLSVFASAYTMTVIAINRYLAIMYPFRKKKCSKFREWSLSKTHVIIAIWLIGILVSMPEYLGFKAIPFCFHSKVLYACEVVSSDSFSGYYTIIIYLCTFVIPLSIMTCLYTCIGLVLWRRQMPGEVDITRDLTMHTMRVKVIKMLFVVVLMFAISWLPLQTYSLVMFLNPVIRQNIKYQSWEQNVLIGTYFASHWLSMAHSCLNPLIYCFMNDKFRDDLHDLLCRRDRYPWLGLAKDQASSKLSLQTGGSGIYNNSNNNNINISGQQQNNQGGTNNVMNSPGSNQSGNYTFAVVRGQSARFQPDGNSGKPGSICQHGSIIANQRGPSQQRAHVRLSFNTSNLTSSANTTTTSGSGSTGNALGRARASSSATASSGEGSFGCESDVLAQRSSNLASSSRGPPFNCRRASLCTRTDSLVPTDTERRPSEGGIFVKFFRKEPRQQEEQQLEQPLIHRAPRPNSSFPSVVSTVFSEGSGDVISVAELSSSNNNNNKNSCSININHSDIEEEEDDDDDDDDKHQASGKRPGESLQPDDRIRSAQGKAAAGYVVDV